MKFISVFFLIVTFLAMLCCANATSTSNSGTNLDGARQVIFEYWENFNNYDVEGALAYYEEGYREEEREEVESDIRRLKRFNVSLTLEDVSEPILISDGKVEIKIALGTPIGPKYLKYHLIQVNGQWKICLETSYEPRD